MKRFLLGLGCLFFSLISAVWVAAVEPPWPLDTYWQRLAETRALIIRQKTAPTDDMAVQLKQAAAQWAVCHAVLLPDGTVVPVDHSRLVAMLRDNPPNLSQLDGLLTALLAARRAPGDNFGAAHYRDALTTILNAPEFQWPAEKPSALKIWWENLKRRLWEWLNRLLFGKTAAGSGRSLSSYLLTIGGGLFLLLVLFYVLRGLRLSLVAEKTLGSESTKVHAPLTADAALHQAQTLSTGGDYRTAIRYLYLAALLTLDERGLLHYDRSLTNQEYARTLERIPPLAGIFKSIVNVFDRVWYGRQRVDATAYMDYVKHIEELKRMV